MIARGRTVSHHAVINSIGLFVAAALILGCTKAAEVGSGVNSGNAQPPHPKVLLGKWEGTVRFESERWNPNRTLIVESVEGESALAVKGKYGTTGQDLSPISGTLDTSGSQARLRFTASDRSEVMLDLRDERSLVGTIDLPGFPGRSIRLWKVK
jgi:hypothetical protein